ncbi:hypothetical protein [Nocardia sp. NPDC052112]|uniref:hypothetical protein n=1 Tax=Nocardia sp. NPDC052112 TaxID=3155646 RepID=UPI0034206CEF
MPLTDIAWGWPAPVSRLDKVAHTHAGAVAGLESFTMTDACLPHAVAAVQALREHPVVDADRVCWIATSMYSGPAASLFVTPSAVIPDRSIFAISQ